MDKSTVVRAFENAFHSNISVDDQNLTQNDFRELEDSVPLMKSGDLLHYLPLILVNLLEDLDSDRDASHRLERLMDYLDVTINTYYEKMEQEKTLAVLDQAQSCAMATWFAYIEQSSSTEKLLASSLRLINENKKYWEERCKGIRTPRSLPRRVDDD
jgi:hypothetical protein